MVAVTFIKYLVIVSGQRQSAKHFDYELPNREVGRSGAVGVMARNCMAIDQRGLFFWFDPVFLKETEPSSKSYIRRIFAERVDVAR
jgi:hypothetical protein